jgi:S1-C subfamily serine protease
MNISKIIEKNRNSIVLIDVQIPGEGTQRKISVRGTGFIISEGGKFITCAHVYKQIPENEKEFLGVSVIGKTDEKNITHYNRYKVELLKIDEENDLALMKIITEDKKFKPIDYDNSESIKEGGEAVFIGYPLATELLGMGFGITMTTNRCIISSVKRRGADGLLHFFLIDTHTNNGSSGSPLFSLESGKVIGVVSGKISAKIPAPDGKIIDIPANIGLCRPAKYIDNLLK